MSSFQPAVVRAALSDHTMQLYPALPGRHNRRLAAVLLALRFSQDGDVHCLLIQRASHLRDHPGEIGFPGGKPDKVDRSLADTALREAHEEVGLTGAQPLGRLSSTPLFTSEYRLEPFVAAVPDAVALTPAPAEVSAMFWVSLRRLFNAPHTDAIPFAIDGHQWLSPVFCDVAPRPLYGGSAHILWELLQCLGSPPLLKAGRTSWSEITAS